MNPASSMMGCTQFRTFAGKIRRADKMPYKIKHGGRRLNKIE